MRDAGAPSAARPAAHAQHAQPRMRSGQLTRGPGAPRRVLASAAPAGRARAFDLAYNLAAHGELLFRPPPSQAAPDAGGAPAAEPPGCVAAEIEAAAEAETERFRAWLRLLLGELLLHLTRVRPAAWGAAAGRAAAAHGAGAARRCTPGAGVSVRLGKLRRRACMPMSAHGQRPGHSVIRTRV
jgi:hypothetical protein